MLQTKSSNDKKKDVAFYYRGERNSLGKTYILYYFDAEMDIFEEQILEVIRNIRRG